MPVTTTQPTAFVCPLDWGLGHAARLIPVVHELDRRGYRIVLGGSGRSLALLRHEFPALPHLLLPDFNVRYPAGRSLVPYLILQLPRMLLSLFKEHGRVKELVAGHHFDLVVSDNRYGLYCRNAFTVIITHQLSPRLPALLRWLEYPLYLLTGLLVRRFDACWIPDLPSSEASLSGQLSHRYRLPANARFVGFLSRFSHLNPTSTTHGSHAHPTPTPPVPRAKASHAPRITHAYNPDPVELLIVLSGPEPQRSRLFDLLLSQAGDAGMRTLFICGLVGEGHGNGTDRSAEVAGCIAAGNWPAEPDGPEDSALHDAAAANQITCVPHLPTDRFFDTLVRAGVIVCRPGYSSLMDLAAAGRTAILIPTPGQTEQEYLAEHVSARYGFVHFGQEGFNLRRALQAYHTRKNRGFLTCPAGGRALLATALDRLCKKNQEYGTEAQEKP